MIQYKTINLKLPNSQTNKLNFTMKKETNVFSNCSSNLIEISNGKTNFPHKLLLSDAQASNLCKDFANGLSAITKLLKIHTVRGT